MNRRAYLLLVNFLVADVVVILLSTLGTLNFLINTFDFLTKPLSSSLKSSSVETTNFFQNYFNGNKLQEQNFNLQKENIALKEKLANYNELKNENDFLKGKGALANNTPGTFVLTSVISFNSSDSLLVDKGFNDGIREGNIVLISQYVVLGRVTKANQFSSTIELIGATKSGTKGISVYSNENGKEVKGFLSESNDKNILQVTDILKSNPLNKGSLFQTTGDDKIYPRGLVIGSVDNVDEKDTESVKTASIKLDYDINNLTYIYILKNIK